MRTIVSICLALLSTLLSNLVSAQNFPTKPITIVVPFPPGGVTNPVARLVGIKITESTGQQVLIDNRPGAGAPGSECSRPPARPLRS